MVDVDWTDFAHYETLGGRLDEHEFAHVRAHEPNWPTYETAANLVSRVEEEVSAHIPGMDEHARVIIAKSLGALPYDHPIVSRQYFDETRARQPNDSILVAESYLMRGLDPKPYEQAQLESAIASMDELSAKKMHEAAQERARFTAR